MLRQLNEALEDFHQALRPSGSNREAPPGDVV
jgi:hypothetical protein